MQSDLVEFLFLMWPGLVTFGSSLTKLFIIAPFLSCYLISRSQSLNYVAAGNVSGGVFSKITMF